MEPFRLELSEKNRQQFLSFCELQAEKGQLDHFLLQADEIMKGLQRDPKGFGDPQYHLWHLGLLLGVVARAPLVVRYGVDEARRIVYIRDFALMGQ